MKKDEAVKVTFFGESSLTGMVEAVEGATATIVFGKAICVIRRIADRIPTEAGQHSDDRGQPIKAA